MLSPCRPAPIAADRTPPTPDEHFDRSWAYAVLQQAIDAFRQDCADRRLPHYFQVFERLSLVPAGETPPSHAALAAEMGRSTKDIHNILHRARKNFRDVLREIIAGHTLNDAAAQEEIERFRALFSQEGGL